MSQSQEPATPTPELTRFRLGEWEVRRNEGILSAGGRTVRLEPRVMDVLVHLAANPGRVVSKEELLEAVWFGMFVEEGALSQAIHSLRKALRDDARQPRYIQTIPKRGYRLVASVEFGREQTAEVPPDPSEALLTQVPGPRLRPRTWAWLLVAITGLAIVLGLVLLDRGRVREARNVPVAPPAAGPGIDLATRGIRIVVLPFEDLGRSGDPFFALGLTQELTKDLGSLPSLEVIYRTISLQKEAKSLHEIASKLGVDYVLTGTVQWAQSKGRPRVRIWPQLVRVDGVQVWADSFASEVRDVFEVQAEISRRVIASLGINLLPEQDRVLRKPSTKNLDALRAYMRGLSLKDQPFYSEENLRKAALTFERAVELDPGFAAAWAELSLAHSYLAYNTDSTRDRVRRARESLERAMALDPDLPEVRLARAYYAYRCREDFDGALAQLQAAARLFPNDAEVFKALGLLLRRKGRLGEAIAALKHAEWLDPKTGELVWILPETHRALRNFEAADRGFAQAISQAPDEPFFWEQWALNRLAWTGDPRQARSLLDESGLSGDPMIEAAAFRLDLDEGEDERALARLSPDWVRRLVPETQARIAMLAALARERLGDRAGALTAAEANRADLVKKIEKYQQRGFLHACLAVALAQLGRSQEALAQIQQAARVGQSDAFSGPRIGEIQALVDLILGRRREAIDRLARLLATPYRGSLTTTDLRLDPVWKPLHGDPAFENLLR
ncbi:MAG TPA: winged helix-turn-helix domain-containing protein [Thermoanaerobaculia bacterium]|nr:winged helix-turn-helix domain-containing protein [Thermoanaerobaculia bacterium]